MGSISVIRNLRPVAGAHLPREESVLHLGPRPAPDARSNLGEPVVLVVGVPPKRSRLAEVVVVALILCALVAWGALR